VFKFLVKHILHGICLKFSESIVVSWKFANKVFGWLEDLTLCIRHRENTFWHLSLVRVLVVVQSDFILGLGKLHHVKLVVSLLHIGFPVIVLVIVAMLHEFLRDKLRGD
jgi:hypothetical protein